MDCVTLPLNFLLFRLSHFADSFLSFFGSKMRFIILFWFYFVFNCLNLDLFNLLLNKESVLILSVLIMNLVFDFFLPKSINILIEIKFFTISLILNYKNLVFKSIQCSFRCKISYSRLILFSVTVSQTVIVNWKRSFRTEKYWHCCMILRWYLFTI